MRSLKRLKIKLLRLVDPQRFYKSDKSERYAIMTVLRVIKNPNTEILMHPNNMEYFINAKDDDVFIYIYYGESYISNLMRIINHKYSYDVHLSMRHMNNIMDIIIDTMTNRRENLKKQYLNNTEISLKSIYDCINK